MTFISFFVLVAVLSLTTAITFLECGCSPSTRGYRINVLTELKQSREQIIQFSAELFGKIGTDLSLKPVDIAKNIDLKVVSLWKSCLANYKHEECVNADTALRVCGTGKNCNSFCKYNPATWINILDGKNTASCDKSAILSSDDPNIIAGNPEKPTVVRPSATPTQTPTPSSIPAPFPSKKPEPFVPVQNSTNSNSSASNNIAASSTPNVTGTPLASPIRPEGGFSPPAASGTAAVNEGCVAIEHLNGYDLQHKNHLRRMVLCSSSEQFCATPNHAIIVDGKWTSMKQLCKSTWNCVRTVKLVNNLRITSHRRATISEGIILTPFDIRYPRWCVWVVQILEMGFNGVGLIEIIAGSIALFLYNRKQ